MLTDVCNHRCAFCSVQSREGQSLSPEVVKGYIGQLKPLGLKAVILSGGGNPILYKNGGWDFNDAVDFLHGEGLEIGVITNGMPLRFYPEQGVGTSDFGREVKGRHSWNTVRPETLDKLTWVRISMSGLDHKEEEVFVPEIDRSKTTLGFSYVAHDIYEVPEEPHHGKVSTTADLAPFGQAKSVRYFEDRIPELTLRLADYCETFQPRYVRLLPNCLEPHLISMRCRQLESIANAINPGVVFVQHKPPQAPPNCWLGYLHPVLNCDGYVYPCDSCVLNKDAHHKFAVPWRVCKWDEIGKLYEQPARSLIKDTNKLCPGCVFTKSNELLQDIMDGKSIPAPDYVEHPNFV